MTTGQVPTRPRGLSAGDAATLEQAQRCFAGRRVVVVGDTILDCYRLGDGTSRCYAGGAAVIASHLRRLGAAAQLITLMGHDTDAQRARQCLQETGVTTTALPRHEPLPHRVREAQGQDQTRTTPHKSQELYRPPPPGTVNRVAQTIEQQVEPGDVVVFADFGYGTVCPELLDRVAAALRRRGCFLAGDVSGPRVSLLAMRGFDLLTPTEAELRRLVAHPEADAPLEVLAPRLRRDLNVKHLLVTRDRRGCVRFGDDGSATHAASLVRRVVDVVGAGDALLAVTGLAMATGFATDAAVRLGQIAAAAAVGELGNAPLTWARLRGAAAVAAMGWAENFETHPAATDPGPPATAPPPGGDRPAAAVTADLSRFTSPPRSRRSTARALPAA